VFIGVGLHAEDLQRRLDFCLTESWPSENPAELADENDCFPVWRAAAARQ